MTGTTYKFRAVLLAVVVTVSVVAGVVGFSTPARAAQSVGNQKDIASHADSTSQSFTITFDLPPRSITCTLDVSQMKQYGVTVTGVSASGSDKFSIKLNNNGKIEFTIESGTGQETVTVTITMSTETVQIPNKPINNTADCSSTQSNTASHLTRHLTVQSTAQQTQQKGFTIEETGIQDTTETTIHSNDTTIKNDTTLTQSIDLDLLVPDDADQDGDTYNVTIDTQEALANGINVTGASVETDPSGADALVEVVGSPTVTADENVTLTIREAAADRDNGNVSRETITVAVTLDATQHTAGDFTAADNITHVITDEAGNTTAKVSFDSQTRTTTANVSVTNYTASPTTVSPSETVTINATVENTGNASGTIDVSFVADGTTFTTKTVSVGASATTHVETTTNFSTAGTHNVTVNDLDATNITVQAPANVSVTDYTVDNTTVQTGETVTVTATVENTGGASGSTTVEFYADGTAFANQTVTVGAGNNTTVFASTSFAAAGTHNVTVEDLAATNITVQEPAAFNVSYSVDNTTVQTGESVTVTATVENTGDVSGSTTVEFYADGMEFANQSVTLDGGNSTTVSASTSFSSAGTHNVTVNNKNATDITVNAPANASVTSFTAPDAVNESETFTVNATVENTDDVTAENVTVTLYTDGTEAATKTVDVEPGTEYVTFQTSFTDAGTHTVSVNDLAAKTVTVEDTTAPTAAAGMNQTVGIDADFELNASGSTDNVGITSYMWDVDNDGTYELSGETVTHNYSTTGDHTVTLKVTDVAGNTDTDAVTITVQAPANVSVTDYTVDKTTVQTGETVTVNATVENTGGVSGDITVTLYADGTEATNTTVSVAGGATEHVELSTSFSTAGTHNITVNDLNATDITVQAPAAFDVSYSVDNTTVKTGETVTVTATVTNTGDVRGTTNVTFYADGAAFATKTVTVDDGNSTTVSAATSFSTAGNHTVTVNDLVATEINVSAQPTGPGDVTGNGMPATDPDGDGLYEDVNGDGTVTFGDAVDLAFLNFDALSPQFFDFDGDGDVDFDDVVDLAFSV